MAKKNDREFFEEYIYYLAYKQAVCDITQSLFKAFAEFRMEEMQKLMEEKAHNTAIPS